MSFVHNIAKGEEGKEKREKLVSVPILFCQWLPKNIKVWYFTVGDFQSLWKQASTNSVTI